MLSLADLETFTRSWSQRKTEIEEYRGDNGHLLTHNGHRALDSLISRSSRLLSLLSTPDDERGGPCPYGSPPTPSIVVCGSYRSGSTALQALLASSGFSTTTARECWAGVEWYAGDTERARRQIRAEQLWRASATPQLSQSRKVGPSDPEECLALQRDLLFGGYFEIALPGFVATHGPPRISATDLRVYWHYLSHVAAASNRRNFEEQPLVLKSPAYLYNIHTTREVYPGSLLVVLRRERGRQESLARLLHDARAGLAATDTAVTDSLSLESMTSTAIATLPEDVLLLDSNRLAEAPQEVLALIRDSLG